EAEEFAGSSRREAPSSARLALGKDIPYDAVMITSKLTSKAQTTIPQPVRAALRVRSGDELVYEIDGDRAILTKRKPAAVDDPFRTFDEWNSDADRRAYAKL
ncbi:MAG: AbrB/MazE/SpoVT family DNA-binding domain-containing protein, partial [Candidatus Binatia bacterium]